MPDHPMERSWSPAQVAAMQRLRDWATAFAELNQRMAAWMGLSVNEATALGQVVWEAEAGTPISPAELSHRIALTSGATTLLLDRLERAGLVARSRESADRRRVTLRPTAAAVEQTHDFLAVAGAEIAAALAASTPAELAATTGFLTRMTEASRAATRRLDAP